MKPESRKRPVLDPAANASEVNCEQDIQDIVVLSCPSSSSSLCDVVEKEVAGSSDAKKARSGEDPDQPKLNQDWDEVVADMKANVEELVGAKRNYFDKLKKQEFQIENVIIDKKTLLLNQEMQISRGLKNIKATMAKFKEEEERLKLRLKFLQEEKGKCMKEFAVESFNARESQDELEEEMESLNFKRDQIKSKLENFKKVSLANNETRTIFEGLIKEKMKDLECPVCLDEAAPPIFSCKEMHVICSSCRDAVVGSMCPVCRGNYGKERMRHRFAEKMSEELGVLRKKLSDLE